MSSDPIEHEVYSYLLNINTTNVIKFCDYCNSIRNLKPKQKNSLNYFWSNDNILIAIYTLTTVYERSTSSVTHYVHSDRR